MKQIARAYPQGEIHVILDNVSTHRSEEVRIVQRLLWETPEARRLVGAFAESAAAVQLDMPGSLGFSLFNGMLLVVTHLITDILYAVFDPRVRLEWSRPTSRMPGRLFPIIGRAAGELEWRQPAPPCVRPECR